MKLVGLLLLVVSISYATAPDGQWNYRFTNRVGEPTDGIIVYAATTSSIDYNTTPINNTSLGCVGWQLSYNLEGFTGSILVNLQTASKVWTSGLAFAAGSTWSTYGGTATLNTLPLTGTSQGTYVGYGYYPFLRIQFGYGNGSTGSADIQLSCWKSIVYANTIGSGSGGGAAARSFDLWDCTRDSTQGTWGAGGISAIGPAIQSSASDSACSYSFSTAGTNYIVFHHTLPSTWSATAGLTANIYWYQTSTSVGSGNVEWDVSTYCCAAGCPIYNSNPTYNAAQATTVAVPSGNNLAITPVSAALTQTGCVAGDILYIKVLYNNAGGTTYTNAVNLQGIALVSTE